MWVYEKKLEYPVKIKNTNPKLAKIIIAQYGGPDGELGAALRYLSQRFTMVTPQAIATLNDVGTEELAHLEMIGTICHQLTDNATPEQMREAGLDARYIDHGLGIFPESAGGIPWTATYIQSKGDPITDLYENMAADAAPSQRQRREWKNRRQNFLNWRKNRLRIRHRGEFEQPLNAVY
jgi:spore coat protein JC